MNLFGDPLASSDFQYDVMAGGRTSTEQLARSLCNFVVLKSWNVSNREKFYLTVLKCGLPHVIFIKWYVGFHLNI
jgi:hypothetical protein